MTRAALSILLTGVLLLGCGDDSSTEGTGGAGGAAAGASGKGGTAGKGGSGAAAGSGGAAAGAGGSTAGSGGAAGAAGSAAGSGGSTAGSGGAAAGSGGSTAGSGGAASGSGGAAAGAGGAGAGGAGAGGGGACTPVDGSGVFSAPNVWTKDVSCEPVSPASASIIGALTQIGGWGTGLDKLQLELSLVVLHADAAAPMVKFQTNDPAGVSPDCELLTEIPLPPGGAIEGTSDYTSCDAENEDCHLLIVHAPSQKLYEIYQARMVGDTMTGGCAVTWDLTKTYPENMRGEQCTSADAAGFPMAAMLPDADEVASGTITHAMRFALPNLRMAKGVYVHPASHAGAPAGDAALPPYGARFRLRADFPLDTLPSDAARTIARGLQRFGMFLSDGGNVPLMLQSDQFTTHKWEAMGLDTHALFGISPSDFEVVDLGDPVTLTYECKLNP